MTYNVISLEDMKGALGEEKIQEILKDYQCTKNKDVEYFIKEKAVEFMNLGISKTFLITTMNKEKVVLVGYFTLTNKITRIKKITLSKTMQKRIRRFIDDDSDVTFYTISLPLIGQLGKNYKNNYNNLISGNVLLKLACNKIKEAQQILGGKFVFLECEDKTKLRIFYESNGFVCFGKRSLENDEKETNQGEYLLQMLRYLGAKE